MPSRRPEATGFSSSRSSRPSARPDNKGFPEPVPNPDDLTDYCTAVPDFDIGYICKDHDLRYERGGTARDRMRDDAAFREYIIRHGKRKGQPIRYWVLAWIYWVGVRLFGHSHYEHRRHRWDARWALAFRKRLERATRKAKEGD